MAWHHVAGYVYVYVYVCVLVAVVVVAVSGSPTSSAYRIAGWLAGWYFIATTTAAAAESGLGLDSWEREAQGVYRMWIALRFVVSRLALERKGREEKIELRWAGQR